MKSQFWGEGFELERVSFSSSYVRLAVAFTLALALAAALALALAEASNEKKEGAPRS